MIISAMYPASALGVTLRGKMMSVAFKSSKNARTLIIYIVLGIL
jgi:hypothetical protein